MIALDVRVFHWLNESFNQGGWLALMSVLTVIGSGWGMLLILPLFASPRTRRFAAWLLGVLTVTAVIVFTLKIIVRRPRPYLVLPGITARVFEAPTGYSFPSGHAAGSFAFATFVAVVMVTLAAKQPRLRKRRIVLSAFALVAALGIAISRCVLGVHFPGDVLAGAMIGATVGSIGARMHLARGGRISAKT